MDKELYTKLLTLRSRLKVNFKENGRSPLVCSDEALVTMSTFVPKKMSDFYAIDGIGDTFVEKYGEYFLRVIDDYNSRKTCVFDDDMKSTLFNLENRLVNISQSNKLLYVGRLYSKHAVDLYNSGLISDEANSNMLDFILGKKSKVVLCNTKSGDKFDQNLYKSANVLIREISRQYKETGEFDMYIGYPFVLGYHSEYDFKVNAPLILFPVTYEKTNDKIVLKKDESRDILYNSNLLLLKNKLENKNRELPSCEVEDFEPSNFIEKALEFYEENGIEISDSFENKFSKFEEYTEKTFPKKLQNYVISYKAVLGRFSFCNSAIQRDYKKMIETNRVNSLVEKLISDIKDVDFFEEDETKQKDVEYSENDCYYINELNSSQENAIVGIHEGDELVIQGPPGTGKSQTITSIISDFVCKNKNVLVVSQKKVALEVIYSRLGNLSKYAMLLSAGGDKNAFYSNLSQMFSSTGRVINYQEKLDLISTEIETTLKDLEKIKQVFVRNTEDNGNILSIYDENINNYFLSHNEELSQFFENVSSSLLDLEYLQLKTIKQKFDDVDSLKSMLKLLELIRTYPWLKSIKSGLQSYSKNALMKSIQEFSESQNEHLKKSFFRKIFSSHKQRKKLKNILNEYFVDNKSFKLLYKNPDNFSNGIKVYNEYLSLYQIYSTLTQTEQEYLNSIYKINNLKIYSIENLNQYVFDFLIHCKIENFEINQTDINLTIQNYSKICLKLKNLINEKIELTKKQTSSILSSGINLIKSSKRFSEIQRLCENKHKRDIKKFTEKYSYELLKGIKVWLLTPEAVSEILPMQDGLFDVVVFDEASQIYIERSLPTIFRGKKVVVSGDHKQLRPSSLGFGRIDSDEDEYLEDDPNSALDEESLLDLARFKYPQIMLNYHYRSKFQELIQFSNYAFYKGNLNISPNKCKEIEPPIQVIKIDNGFWDKRANLNEGKRVVELVKEIFKTRANNETIGIVTFNVTQQDLILDLLEKECVDNPKFASIYKKECDRQKDGEDIGLFVKNIENVQGDERDIIIFSTAYAKNETGKIVRNFGWLNQKSGENRLNVAISRAKRHIFIVTSIVSSELYVDDLKNEGPKLFKKYLEYAEAVSNNDETLSKAILNSLSETNKIQEHKEFGNIKKDLVERLANAGYEFDTNIGIGNYAIDIAIKNGNDYILAIEFAKDMLDKIDNTRERDIHRQKFLSARGFKSYRVWENEYYHNPDKILSEIKKEIENQN